jgi:hypothetical protein
MCGPSWSAAVALGIRTTTGRKRDNRWISFESTLAIEKSESSNRILAFGFAEACASGATVVFITAAM